MYVPVSKTVLDPVLVWFLTIRYDLPIPALILDEALAILGPFSDLLRLAGAVFIKRDPHARSTLATAVTSAYVQFLMRERGALTIVLDQVRSRTGVFQKPFQDGLVDMIIKEGGNEEDVIFVPINITYEEVPDISILIGQDLQAAKKKARGPPPSPTSPTSPTGATNSRQLTRSKTTTSNRMSTPTRVSRPSDSRAQRVRSRSLGSGYQQEDSTHHASGPLQMTHCGRLLVGVGNPISLLHDIKKLQKRSKNNDISLAQLVINVIQKEQKKSIAISPISLVAAILLYSRVKGNCIDLGRSFLDNTRV